jgi:hypothetical protein
MRTILNSLGWKEAVRGSRIDTAVDLIAKVVLVLGILFMACAGAKGSIYSIVPASGDLKDLKQNYNYTWGIDRPWSMSQEVVSATLSFSKISNKDKSPNILYIYLLDKTKEGVNSGKDTKGGDYFGTQEAMMITCIKLSAQAQDLSYRLNPEQVKMLNTYASDNTFGLGFDPDGRFYNSGVKLEIVTGSPVVIGSPVPEPQTLVLLALGSVVWIKRYAQKQTRKSVGS